MHCAVTKRQKGSLHRSLGVIGRMVLHLGGRLIANPDNSQIRWERTGARRNNEKEGRRALGDGGPALNLGQKRQRVVSSRDYFPPGGGEEPCQYPRRLLGMKYPGPQRQLAAATAYADGGKKT
ncbi:hypothetical protein PG994_002597 [Apiospora phragmitis]|uniref:Uncharacterized protein n=1 Tax=Apiospora phragmitis TaxID=2905665 RepID=A0ABR1W5K7_9PEZI